MSESALWRFSLAFYRQPGVADALLRLQDEAGADVNVILYLLFLAGGGRRIDASDLDRIDEIAAVWRHAVVIPLREVRRKLKASIGPFEPSTTSGLRNDVKRIELGAERLQQEALARLFPLDPSPAGIDRRDVARANVSLYGERLGGLSAEPLELILEMFAKYAEAH